MTTGVIAAPAPGPEFSTDWFTQNIPLWTALFGPLRGFPLAYLEVGSFQGRSVCWMMDNVLTGPDSRAHCVDTWEGSVEHSAEMVRDLYDIFCRNVERYGDRVVRHRGRSQEVLKRLAATHAEHFDIVYIDGDHHSWAVLEDAVLGFALLKPGGVLVFDDYMGGTVDDLDNPHRGIKAFAEIFSPLVRLLHSGYQLVLLKKERAAT